MTASIRVSQTAITTPPNPAIRVSQASLTIPGSPAPAAKVQVSQASLTTPAPAAGGTARVSTVVLTVPIAPGQQPDSGLRVFRGGNLAGVSTRAFRGGEL